MGRIEARRGMPAGDPLLGASAGGPLPGAAANGPLPGASADALAIDLPGPLAELREAFARYERALTGNDVAVLDELFRDSPVTVRLGATENLYGYAAIRAFRKGRSPKGLARSLRNTVITTWGEHFGHASTEFVRDGEPRIGRQTQTWVRTPAGWRIVAAHVSWMDG